MARIPILSGFSLIPEGTYTFKINKVEYKEAFGKMELSLVTPEGYKHTEKFSLMDKDGNWNEKALGVFSFTAKVALNRFDLAEGETIDPKELVGCFFKATVEHDKQPNKNDPSKTVTFVRLTDKAVSDGSEFGASNGAVSPASKSGIDLSKLL